MEKHLIDQLGGTGEVADAIGVSPSVVSNWRSRGVPWQWRPTLADLAATKHIALPKGFLRPAKTEERAA